MKDIFVLLIAFQLKHFLCDFPLQGRYMLGKFKGGIDWILPLALHAYVHAVVTFGIAFFWLRALSPTFDLALADFTVHFMVDRLKASPNLGGRWKPTSPFFWWALGADQMAHHLTHYWIIYKIMGASA